MIIECELLNQPRTFSVESVWTHSPLDPLAVKVKFGGKGPIWSFSLDLLMDAFTSPEGGTLHGYGDFLIEVGDDFTIVHLGNGDEAASLRFSTADIQLFLERVDTPSSEEVIARKLDEFLETL